MSSYLSDLITLSFNNGVATLTARGISLRLIATNATTAVPSGTEDISSISFSLPDSTNGVLVLGTKYRMNTKLSEYDKRQFCLPITRKGERIIVDLENAFNSPLGVIQANDYGSLFLAVGSEKFASPGHVNHTDDLRKKGYRIINNPDLICRFVTGGVSLDVLKEASGPDPRSAMQKELEELRQRFAEIQGELADIDEKFKALNITYKGKIEMVSELESRLAEKERIHQRFVEATNGDIEAMSKNITRLQGVIRDLGVDHRELLIQIKDLAVSGDHFGSRKKAIRAIKKTAFANLNPSASGCMSPSCVD